MLNTAQYQDKNRLKIKEGCDRLVKDFLHSKLLKNSMWLFVLQVFNTVIPMMTLPYITRVLGKAGYGDFSLALNWILYFQVIVEYGFGFWGGLERWRQIRKKICKIHLVK